jgi:hypothetical protein
VVLRAAFVRFRRERVLAVVLHPESRRVADVAPFVFELWNINSDERVARTFVELGNLVVLLGDGAAEGSRNALRHEGRRTIYVFSHLISERVIVTAEEDRPLEFIVPHRGVVEDFVLVDQIYHIFRLNVAQRDVELPVVTSKSFVLLGFMRVSDAVVHVIVCDAGVGSYGYNVEGG